MIKITCFITFFLSIILLYAQDLVLKFTYDLELKDHFDSSKCIKNCKKQTVSGFNYFKEIYLIFNDYEYRCIKKNDTTYIVENADTLIKILKTIKRDSLINLSFRLKRDEKNCFILKIPGYFRDDSIIINCPCLRIIRYTDSKFGMLIYKIIYPISKKILKFYNVSNIFVGTYESSKKGSIYRGKICNPQYGRNLSTSDESYFLVYIKNVKRDTIQFKTYGIFVRYGSPLDVNNFNKGILHNARKSYEGKLIFIKTNDEINNAVYIIRFQKVSKREMSKINFSEMNFWTKPQYKKQY